MSFQLPVPIVDQIGNRYTPTEIEVGSIIDHIHHYQNIEPSWMRSITVNVQELGNRPHMIIVRGYFMNNSNDPFTLSFSAGASPEFAMCSHEALKKSA